MSQRSIMGCGRLMPTSGNPLALEAQGPGSRQSDAPRGRGRGTVHVHVRVHVGGSEAPGGLSQGSGSPTYEPSSLNRRLKQPVQQR